MSATYIEFQGPDGEQVFINRHKVIAVIEHDIDPNHRKVPDNYTRIYTGDTNLDEFWLVFGHVQEIADLLERHSE